MLFRSKAKKSTDIKNSFHDFMRREKETVQLVNQSIHFRKSLPQQTNLTDETSYQLLRKSQNKTQTEQSNEQSKAYKNSGISYNPLPSPNQMIQDGSCKSSGTTWDANHMDQFLKYSKFVQTEEQIKRKSSTIQDTNMDNQSQMAKYSFFSMNKSPRIVLEENGQHKFFQSHKNHHITEPGNDIKQIKIQQEFINQQMYKVPQKLFNQEKLNYTPNPDAMPDLQIKLTKPLERRQELEEAKLNKEQFQQWRSDYFDKNKAYKVAKVRLNGIVSIENPERLNTVLYREQEALIKNNNLLEGTKKHRELVLKKFNSANPTTQFDNANHIESTVVQNKYDDLLNKHHQKFPQQNYEIQHNWDTKKRVISNDGPKTNDRLFGNNFDEIKNHTITQRAIYLRYQDLRGKKFNLINMASNDLYVQK